MNYLAHHTLALRLALASATSDFFVGNVLPDLLSANGVGRLRDRHIAARTPTPLLQGARLHFAADRAFHGSAAFATTMALAKAVLLATPFSRPLERVFFLAHAMVEIALDGLLLREEAGLANDLYARFAATDLSLAADQAARWFTPTIPPFLVEAALNRFAQSAFLRHYDDSAGLAEALFRLSQRAGLSCFDSPEDQHRLASAFEVLLGQLPPFQQELLTLSLPPA